MAGTTLTPSLVPLLVSRQSAKPCARSIVSNALKFQVTSAYLRAIRIKSVFIRMLCSRRINVVKPYWAIPYCFGPIRTNPEPPLQLEAPAQIKIELEIASMNYKSNTNTFQKPLYSISICNGL